jgi:hypothetical protein
MLHRTITAGLLAWSILLINDLAFAQELSGRAQELLNVHKQLASIGCEKAREDAAVEEAMSRNDAAGIKTHFQKMVELTGQQAQLQKQHHEFGKITQFSRQEQGLLYAEIGKLHNSCP